MTKLKAHIEGDKIVLDEPLPQPIKPDIQVEVVLYDPEDHPLSPLRTDNDKPRQKPQPGC